MLLERNLPSSRVLKRAFNIMLEGEYFEPTKSKGIRAFIKLDNGKADIFRGNNLIYKDIEISSVQDGRNVFLSNSSLFISDQEIKNEILKGVETSLQQKIKWLEVFTFKRALVFAVILLSTLLTYRLIFNSVTNIAVTIFPETWERRIGQSTYEALTFTVLDPSELSQPKIDELTKQAQKFNKVVKLSPFPEIIFHKSDFLGANALAFPGGPIVVTDELVALLGSDELILAVIAHELAHIIERHSLRQILDTVGVAALASVLFGADETILEEMTAVTINLWALKNSRAFEKEADIFAMEILPKAGFTKESFFQAIEKLTQSYCEASQSKELSDCLEKSSSGWFSSHPSGTERLQYLEERQK